MAVGFPQANIFLLIATVIQPIVYYLSRASLSQTVYANFIIQFALFVSLSLYISIKGKLKNI